MKVAVLSFPGSNCDRDCVAALQHEGHSAELLFHTACRDLRAYDMAVLPGGFSYGDYLRAGVLAAHSPALRAIKEFAQAGGFVLGICNGFQILCEAGLLPGALVQNQAGRFICRKVFLSAVNGHGEDKGLAGKSEWELPIAHAEGRYLPPQDAYLAPEVFFQKYALFCYGSEASLQRQGESRSSENPNGSWKNIAGVRSEKGNVVGLMPHPERAVLGPWTDGRAFWKWMNAYAQKEGKGQS